jgi:hypothetical protein
VAPTPLALAPDPKIRDREDGKQATHRDVLLLIHLAALEDVLLFLHFYVHSFESQLLATLLQCVVGKDLVHEGVDQMVESPVALPMQKLPFEHMMPSKSQLTAN